jgi:hypothetical protein
MRVVLAEKPSVARELASFLGATVTTRTGATRSPGPWATSSPSSLGPRPLTSPTATEARREAIAPDPDRSTGPRPGDRLRPPSCSSSNPASGPLPPWSGVGALLSMKKS